MNLVDFTNLIGGVGFPIACSIFMMCYINTTIKDFQKVLENNTIAITKMSVYLKDLDDRGNNK